MDAVRRALGLAPPARRQPQMLFDEEAPGDVAQGSRSSSSSSSSGNRAATPAPKPPEEQKKSLSASLKTLKMLVPFFWPKGELGLRFRVVICLTLIVIGKVFSVSIPQIYAAGIDHLSQDPPTFPLKLLLLYGLFYFLSNAVGDLRDSLFTNVSQYATRKISVSTFDHLHHLSLQWHLKRDTGAVLRTIDRGTSSATTLLGMLLFNIAPTLLEFLMVVGVLLKEYGGAFALITFVTIVLYVTFTLMVTEWRTKFRRTMNEKENATNQKSLDSLINFETVKYFAAEKHEVQRYAESLDSYFEVSLQSRWSLSGLNWGQTLIISVGLLISIVVSGKRVAAGELNIGDFVAIQSYIIQLYSPLNFLGTSYRMINQAFIDMEKMFQLLEETSDVRDADDAPPIRVDRGMVEFHDVEFYYDQRAKLLKNISFTIPPGHTVGIVGSSGSGKSTIARLMMRLYDVKAGCILVDGQDISTVRQASLRRIVGIVPQDTVLFNDTIKYNIRFGRPDATDEEVYAAAKEAAIHDFIMESPDGYETKVGERGLRLSGGQKQRVAIARAILKNPTIMILDEATSALDTKTEKDIQAALNKVAEGRTTFIIAHRLSTLVNANEILVLKEGEIIERGNHNFLLALGGEYRNMWQQQALEEDEQLLLDS